MTKFAIGAVVGGLAVLWYIKRTCPCQHAAATPATSTTPATTPASSATGVAAIAADTNRDAGDLFSDSSSSGGEYTSTSSSSGCSSCGELEMPL